MNIREMQALTQHDEPTCRHTDQDGTQCGRTEGHEGMHISAPDSEGASVGWAPGWTPRVVR